MKIPKLIYGTAWKKERTTELVHMAIRNGFRGIDTACQPKHYDEHLVGEALSRLYEKGLKREELFLQTKFTPISGQDPKSIPYDPRDSIEQQIAYSFEVSKKNLRTDYLDSYVLHSSIFPYEHLLSAWSAMEKIYKRGDALHLGISNCYDLELLKHLYRDAHVKPSYVQNRFYSQSGYDKELRMWCDSHNIVYQSFWSLTANPHILNSDILGELAKKYTKSEAQIFYRYLSHKGIVPLIGSTSTLHVEQDLSIFELYLNDEEIKSIDALLV